MNDQNISWWKLSESELVQKLETNSHQGLSSEEAKKRLRQFGYNLLPEKHRVSALQIFINQFNSLIIWILISAAAIAGFLGEWIDSIAIVVIVIMNAILGFVQEFRAEKSLEALRKLSNPTSEVIRNGVFQVLASREIVPGDVVLIEAGDRIPADGRLIETTLFRTQEAALTGESLPLEKVTHSLPKDKTDLGDRKNMVFMGTVAVYGKAKMVVTDTGLKTELGKIARLLESHAEEKTPLQIQLEKLGKKLVFICLAVVGIVFALGVLRQHTFLEMLLTSLSLAVAAIPEGLPAVVTISLAMGVRKMAKRNALIRRLASVETLGCASVICTDKTGTLTQNEMAVRQIWISEHILEVTGVGYIPEGFFRKNGNEIAPSSTPDLIMLLKGAVLCNSAALQKNDQGWTVIGDPTEGALLTAAGKARLEKSKLEKENPILGEIPFDSERKRMSMLRETSEGKILFVKGAPDVLLKLSDSLLLKGQVQTLNQEMRNQIEKTNSHFAHQALRVLAVAYRKVEGNESLQESIENKLTFVGLLAMMDPPRSEAKKAIQECKDAGIRTVMITGDHKETAVAIGEELGLIHKGFEALSGAELDQLSDEDFVKKIERIAVYARVSAEHKLRIVRAWRRKGAVVAMTGDGVNDAPAVKEADIGVAMGITGTDVTKEASDMVITDDNFASIVNAVEEGRGIYDNIVKFVKFLLSFNLAEIMIIFIAMLIGLTDKEGTVLIPLSAVQLLWMNLVTDGFPAIALGVDPLDPEAMKRAPRKPSETILSSRFTAHLLVISLLVTVAGFAACLYGLQQNAALAQTMTLTTLVVLELVGAQMVRETYHLNLFSNPWLVVALLVSFLAQLAIIYIAPFQKIFGTVALGGTEWVIIGLLAFAVWILGNYLNRILQKRNL